MTTSSVPRERTTGEGIGHALRSARAERGVSLADLQARTKVRIKYLTALEDERFDELPPLPFARGFLRLVAEELGLDPEPLIRRLNAVMSARAVGSVASLHRLDAAVTPAVSQPRWRRWTAMAVACVLVAGVALAVYSYRQFREFSESAPAAAPPDLEPGGTVSSKPATMDDESQPQVPATVAGPTGEPAAPEGVTVEVQASARSWLRVVVDDQPVFEGFLAAGDSQRWQGRTTVALRAGNAGAVQVTANGRPVGVLGQTGEVVDRTFTRDTPR
ncbi:MAG: DUF4115 domain-containing protein [Armatimonadota bacterium]|nr:DUF4115 domain-containing protein [Armatimonadota bacterium]MDR7518183.1 DUF4115 domain-containing protein [Armatimonadota bacterium]MDR7548437.1 DUF4115 domain-containing protein [Armatimonadota bacterium]